MVMLVNILMDVLPSTILRKSRCLHSLGDALMLTWQSKNKPVWVDPQGFHASVEHGTAWRDKKGNLIHCFQCKKTTVDGQPLVTCDYEGCGNAFHLDCLYPMRATLPCTTDKTRNQWICPVHVDEHDIPNLTYPSWVGAPPEGRDVRFPRIRKPKIPSIRSTILTRGHVNNGLIEVVFDSDDEEDEFIEESAPRRPSEPEGDDVVYRIPAKGIKLDFIAKAKE